MSAWLMIKKRSRSGKQLGGRHLTKEEEQKGRNVRIELFKVKRRNSARKSQTLQVGNSYVSKRGM